MKKKNHIKVKIALKKAIAGYKKFIETFVDDEGENKGQRVKAFNYYKYTNFCCNLSYDTANGGDGGGYILRDMAMEAIDPKFNAAQPYKFLGMETLD